MKPTHILITALLLLILCAAPAAADAVTHNGKTYTTYDQIYASTTLSSSEKLSLVREMAGWTEELAAYMEWKNSGGLEAYQAAVSGGNSTSSDYGWNEAPGDGLGDGGTNIEPEYSYQERQAYDAAYAAYQAEFAENYAATAAYTGSGSGTQADPYIITTPAELQSMQDDLTAYYKLGNDIDLSSVLWVPIAGQTSGYYFITGFSGTLDGNGYTISGLSVENTNTAASQMACCFMVLNGGTVKNVKIIDFTFKQNNLIAGANVYTPCVFNAFNLNKGNIINCEIDADTTTIITTTSAGPYYGSATIIHSCDVFDCIITGNIDAGSNYISSSSNTVSTPIISNVNVDNVYVSVNLISGNYIYGILESTSSTASVSNSVFVGTTSKSATGRVTSPAFTGTLSNNYVVNTVLPSSTDANSYNGADVSASTLATQSFYQNTLGWDFVNTWYWDDETNTPQLQIFHPNPPTISSISATPSIGGQQDTYTLSVSASTTAAGGIASYQWYGRIGSSGEWQAISDGTTATYQFVPGAYALGDFYFKCVVTGADGGVIDSYDAGYTNVKVTVVLAPQITSPAATPTTGPLSQTVQLSADVTSTETVTYQWQELVSGTWTDISGATAATATVNIADTAATTHSYRLLATNVGGTSTSNTVTYQSVAAPTISSVSANPTIGQYTQTITLSAEVTDSGPDATTYQWQQSPQNQNTWANIQGATTAQWIGQLTFAGATDFRLIATGTGGQTISETVTYYIALPGEIQSLTATPSVVTLPGSTTLSATGSNVISWEWQQYTSGVWTPIGYSASVTERFTDAGTYQFRVLATGADGAIVTSETVEVIAGFAPSVSITSPNDGTRYQSGERIPLTATITGTDPTWEWSFGSQDVQTGGNGQTTWVEYGIDGRYTISIRVVSLFGTDEDSITIISGRESRPIATTPPIELESDGIFEATDSLTPNENGMPDITGFIMSMSKPFTDMIGAWFYFVLFAVPYLIIWIRQKNIIIPSILGVLFAAWVLIQLPAAALPAAIALITLSVTGGLYGIYVKLQNR